jgi:NAD(P)-dependent dehydrogenase (short-subunit alcohol dehydrogenase family)
MFDSKILAGRSIVVTGGGSGLGLAMAKAFAAHGAQVTIAGRTRERLEAALPEIRAGASEGGDADSFAADVRDPEQVEKLVAHAVSRFGRVDGLVNNAAICRNLPLAEWGVPGFDEHLATNIRAPYFLIQAALPSLRESALRSVVNISSSSGTLRLAGQSVYGMTKCALPRRSARSKGASRGSPACCAAAGRDLAACGLRSPARLPLPPHGAARNGIDPRDTPG